MFVLPPTETQTMEGVSMRCEISRMSVFVRQHVQNTSLNFHLFINCYGLFSFNSWQFLQHSNLSMYSNNSQLNTHYSLQYTAPGKNLYRCTVISQSKQMANVTCRVKVSLLVVTGILRYDREGEGAELSDSINSESVLTVRLGTQPAFTVYSDVLHWWPTKLKGGKFKRTRLNLIKFSQWANPCCIL